MKKKVRKHDWSERELVFLLLTYEEVPTAKLAKHFGRTVLGVEAKAWKMGLHKSRGCRRRTNRRNRLGKPNYPK